MNPVEFNYRGEFRIMLDEDDQSVSKGLFDGNEYEPHVIPHFKSKCKGVVLDIGANLGVFTFTAAIQPKVLRVFAIEPNPRNCELLNLSSRMQKLKAPISIIQVAASDRSGFGNLLSRGASNGNISSEGILIWMETLDRVDFPWVDVIKIDIEGHEFHALRGATKILEGRPVLFTEFYPRLLKDHGSDPVEYLKFIKKFGYNIFNLSRWNHQPIPCATVDAVMEQYQSAIKIQGEFIAYLDLMCI